MKKNDLRMHRACDAVILKHSTQRVMQFVESLEKRLLLTATGKTHHETAVSSPDNPPDILSSLHSGTRGNLTGKGLEISLSPVAKKYTPTYVMIDPHPKETAKGSLAPFATSGPTGMTATKMRQAYGLNQVMFGNVAGDGSGQTIAIVDAYDYPTAQTDLSGFDAAMGLPDPPSLTRINETGGSTLPGVDPAGKGDDWEVEEALDIEWAHAMAPGASIVLVEATAPDDSDLINSAVNTARNLPGVVAVTMSFGRDENSTDTSLDSYFTTPTGHTGVTFLASTGDDGEPAGYPSFSPNVVAVGGTTLSVDGSGNYLSETGWADSGGGISGYETQPAYQKGIVTQSTTSRTTPDISFDADPASGASVYDTYDFGTSTPWLTVGGTSLSSPSMAGIIAVADQGRALGGVGSLDGPGKTLPRIYQLASSDFHDITSGNNGYSAGVGYDLVTGRGSPIANVFIPQLSAAGPYVVSNTPSGVVTSPPSSIAINFSGQMDPTSFSIASDVDSFTGPGGVDLKSSITGYSWLNSNTTLLLNFNTLSATGAYKLVIGPQILSSGGTAMDQNQNGVAGESTDTFTANFGYETQLLQVASTNPANGSLVSIPFTSLDVHFNEPYDPASIGTTDLTLSQGTVTAASVVDSTTVRYTLSGITTEGTLTISMAAGAVNDANGFGMLAYSGSFGTDIGTRAMPATTGLVPLGSTVYQSTTTANIGTTTDTDSFTISLDPGQTLTVIAHPVSSSLRPSVLVLNPSSTTLAAATAAAANRDAIVQNIPITTAGTYTIVVGSDGTTTGQYSVQAILNAGVESEDHGGATNDTQATAQPLDSNFRAIGAGSAQMGAVIGTLPAATGMPVVTENFESGTLSSAWSTYSSDATLGRIQVSGAYGTAGGNYALLMDHNDPNGVTYNLNEAVWNVDLTGLSAATLSFSQASYSDEDDALASDFTGHANGDGVSISADGTHWHRVWQAVSGTAGVYSTVSVDLAAAAAAAGMTLGPNFKIKFQQYDNYNLTTDGRGWDNITISTPASAMDWYSMPMSAGDSTSVGISKLTAGNVALGLYDSNGNLLASGVTASAPDDAIANFTAPSTGTYYIKVTGNDSQYDLVATRDVAFSVQPHNSFATAQTISPGQGAVGSLGTGGGGGTQMTFSSTYDGWWNQNGTHDSTNTNYITGYYAASSVEDRDYFVFNLSGVTQPIIGATLNLANPSTGFSSADPSETLAISDVSTPLPTLEATGSGQTAIFSDLGSGVTYGTRTVSAADDGQTVSIPLNASAVAALNGAIGSSIAFGGSITTISGTGAQYVFASTDSTMAKQLVLTLGDAADWYSVNAASLSSALAFSTKTPGDGSGEFNNQLIPHLELYDPNGNLVASGTKLADGRNESISYQPLMTGNYRVRVVAQGGTTGEYVLTGGNGLSIAAPSDVTEGDGSKMATITASTAPTSDLSIALSSSDPNRISVQATVTLPAGQTSVQVPLTIVDDSLLNGPETVTISASGAGYFSTTGNVKIHDNETAMLTVTLPSTATEGNAPLSGMVTSSAAPTSDIVIQLSSNSSRLTVPATVTLKAGKTTATFNATVVDDSIIDGTQNATVTASTENWTSGNAVVAVSDNDATLAVTLPASGFEGQTLTSAGTVKIGGTLSTNLTVNLQSGTTSELSVPSTVTILAGQTSATFTVTLLDDGKKSASNNVSVTASANGLSNGSSTIVVHDSDVDHLGFDTISGSKTAGTAFSASVHAYNISNEIIPVYSASGTLSATGQAGSLPVSPTSVSFTSGTWTGSVTLTAADPAVHLTLTSGTLSAVSSTFGVQAAAVSSFAVGTVASPQVAGVPFNETITAKDTYGNTVTSFNGSATLAGQMGQGVQAQTLFGTAPVPTASYNYGTFTIGYAFTPSTNIQVTAVRSYGGSKVEIWTNTGTLLLSQPVSGANGTWTETPLTTPINLSGGTTYRIATYTAGQTYYGRNDMSATSPLGTINGGYEISGDAFPTSASSWQWIFVDLRANIGNVTTVPVTPTGATFTNGVWTGNVTVSTAASNMYLHVDDGQGHTANSNTFNVTSQAPSTPVLDPSTDSGSSSSDGVTNFNNTSAGKALKFSVGNTTSGATVTIYANGAAIGSAVATGTTTVVTTDGSTSLADGNVNITAKQTVSGNTSAASGTLAIRIDTTAPVVAANSLTTADATPPLSGTVDDPAAAVSVSVNSTVYQATNDGTGGWHIADNVIASLSPNTYTVTVTATDVAGNSSIATGSLTIQDTTAPTVVSGNISFDSGPNVQIQFSKDVHQSIDLTDLAVQPVLPDQSLGTAFYAVKVTYDPNTNTASFWLPASLADGNYRALLAAGSVSDGSGNALAADYSYNFFSLLADADHNGTVDSNDFASLAAHYNSSGSYAQGDFNYDGKVNALDFNALATQFGKSMQLPSGTTPAEAGNTAATDGNMSPMGISGAALPPSQSQSSGSLFSSTTVKSADSLDSLFTNATDEML